jgi:phosphatidylserine decarboxylase
LNDALIVSLLSAVPKRRTARCMGLATRLRLPGFAHRWLVRWFVRTYKVDLSESMGEVDDFESLSHFFVRALRPGLRPIDPDSDVIVSPVDAKAHTFGQIEDGMYMQAPNRPSTVEKLVGEDMAKRFEDGSYAVLYLSPPDYHRVHVPADSQIQSLTYRPGSLWPVFAAATRKVDDLFGKNERLVFECDTPAGPMALVMVGAFGVGRILNVLDHYKTNADHQPEHRPVSPARSLTKGEEIGRFELGSTVILLFGKDAVDWTMEADQILRLGRPIAKIRRA